jgi:hypothetical protein
MVRTSATLPIVVVPPTQPRIEAVVPRDWGVQTAWPHFTAFTHSRKRPSLYCWPPAMVHAAFAHSKPVGI